MDYYNLQLLKPNECAVADSDYVKQSAQKTAILVHVDIIGREGGGFKHRNEQGIAPGLEASEEDGDFAQSTPLPYFAQQRVRDFW